MIRVDDFSANSTLIQAVDTRHDLLYREQIINRIYNLLFQWIFIMLINGEVSRESFIQERICILEDDFYVILMALFKKIPWDRN